MPHPFSELSHAETDVLVLGGGIAGHRAAVAARARGARVALAHLARGASPFIIGCNIPLGHVDAREPDGADAERGSDRVAAVAAESGP